MSDPSDVPAAIHARDLRKHFDGGIIKALDGVDLDVHVGQFVAITGASGCGKSTLLHLIAALDRPTSGTLVVDGVDVTSLRDPSTFRRTRVGLVFQLHNLLPHLTAAQNLEVAMFGTSLPRRQRMARAARLLSDVDLAGREDRPPTKLSGGERQRVAIARALVNDPHILLADEPTGNLDRRSVEHVLGLLRRLRSERPRLTLVVVTHDAGVAEAADRVLTMSDGRMVVPAPAATPAGVTAME